MAVKDPALEFIKNKSVAAVSAGAVKDPALQFARNAALSAGEVKTPALITRKANTIKLPLEEERANEQDKMLVPSVSRQAAQNTPNVVKGKFTGNRQTTYTEPTLGERLRSIGAGAVKQYAGSVAEIPALTVEQQKGTLATGVYREQAAALDKQIAALERSLADPTMTARDIAETNEALKIAREQRGIYGKAVEANEKTGTLAREASRSLTASGAADIENAQKGLGTLGKIAVQAGTAGIQMGMDAALGLATGGGSMLPMVVRSFGGGVQEAAQKGYSTQQQIALGLTTAATEYFTEKLFGGNPVYDTDVGLINRLVGKIAGNGKLMAALNSMPADMLSEGLEEVIADILEPTAEYLITGNKDFATVDQIIADGATGVLLSALGIGGKKLGGVIAGKAQNAPQGASNAATARLEETGGNLTGAAQNAPQDAAEGAEMPKAKGLRELEEINRWREEEAAAMKKTASAGETEIKRKFKSDLDSWMKTTTPEQRAKDGGRFLIGHTSEQLKQADVDDYDIYFGKSKIAKILLNLEMTPQIIKEVSDVVERPIIVMDSKTVPGSITMFGESKTGNGKPVMVSMLLHPTNKTGEILDYGVVTSAYGRRTSNAQNLIDTSNIRYIDPDEKRTGDWMKTLGLQLPSVSSATDSKKTRTTQYTMTGAQNSTVPVINAQSALPQSSSTNSMPQSAGNVKMPKAKGLRELEEVKGWNGEAAAEAAERTEEGNNTKKRRNGTRNESKSPLYELDESLESGREMPEEYGEKREYLQDALNELEREREAKRLNAVERKPSLAKRDLKRDIMGAFSVQAGQRNEIGALIEQFADRIIAKERITQQDYDALFDALYDAGVMEVPADESLQFARSALKSGRIYVNDSIKADFGDDWQSFRKRAFAAGIYLTNDDSFRGPDVWNAQLAEDFPGTFNADETDMRSMLEKIVHTAESGKAQKLSLAEYAAMVSREEHISEDAMLDNLARQLEDALHKFAEKQNLETYLRGKTDEKLEKAKAEHREIEQRQRDRYNQWAKASKEHRREMRQKQAERKARRELEQKTLKQLQWLAKNRKKAPEELKKAFNEVIGDLDILAAGAVSSRYEGDWSTLAEKYKQAMADDPNFIPSKQLEKVMMRLDNKKIADMDLGALNDLYRAAVGLRTEYYNRNNIRLGDRLREMADVYAEATDEIKNAKGGYRKGEKAHFLDSLFNTEQLSAMNVLERMGGWNPNGTLYSMAKQLEAGERKTRDYTMRANAMLADFLTKREDWVKTADGQGKNAVWYELEVPELLELGMGDKPIFSDKTVTVYMTPAQKVHLYLESKNYDNLRHMTGGRTFANKELYEKGKRNEAFAQGTTVRLAPETVKKLVEKLTPEEKELADLLEKYYNGFSKKEINAVSNALYGYDKTIGENYAPIRTNQNYRQSEFGVFDVTAESVGNLKERKVSKNPSLNVSAFDAFEHSRDDTARFVGMAMPTSNWSKLMNWQVEGNSFSDILTHKWGEEGLEYINELLKEMQGGKTEKAGWGEKIADGAFSNYVSAVFGFNPSIVTKQLGSIPMAGAYLGFENFPAKGMWKVDRDLISRYTQELNWRGLGFSVPEVKMLKDNPNWTQTNKFTKTVFGGGAITATDTAAAGILWPWAENYVKKNFPELSVGTQEQIDAGQSPFYQKVAEVFNNAVARSQSTSDVIHQSTLRKSKNAGARLLTMFGSDNAQTYNAIRQKLGELSYLKDSKASEKTIRQAKKDVGAAFAGALINAVWGAAMTVLWAMVKNRAKRYRDEDDNLSIAKAVAKETISNLAGVMVFGDQIADAIGAISGERWYGIEAPGIEQVNELIEIITDEGKELTAFFKGLSDVIENDGSKRRYLRENGADLRGSIKTLAEAAAKYFGGIPAANMESYLLGLVGWVSPEIQTWYEDAFDKAEKNRLKGLSGDALRMRTEHVLEERGVEIGQDTAQTLSALYAAGETAAIPSNTPKSVSVDKEERELSAAQRQKFNEAWEKAIGENLDRLTSLESFRKADNATQAKMLDRIYDYAAEQGKAAVFDDFELSTFAKEAQKSPLPLAEHIAFHCGISDLESDKDADGKTVKGKSKKDKVLKVINEMKLTVAQKDALYYAAGYKESTLMQDAPWYNLKFRGQD